MTDVVRITLNGRHAMTLHQLAAHTGRAADTDLRHALRRAGIAPDGRLDGRTPLYLAAPTLKKLASKEQRERETKDAEVQSRSDASVSEPPKS